jgi:hypothetical protein
MEELHFDSFLWTEIPGLLKLDALAGEMRLYIHVGPQTSLKTEWFRANSG